jgi:hypothetical protein
MTELLATSYVKRRGGLGDLPNRLRAEDCTIAYMGASVTAQRDGFRPRLHELICRNTRRDHRAVAAALGATGAITGVFLMDDLVLAHQPDLAFVEYATSDLAGTTPLPELAPALEGIVGKLRDAGCEPCFLYLHRSDVDLAASEVVAAYEDVAEYHAVVSISVADWMRTEIERGRLSDPMILRDVVHTTPAGSTLTAEAILNALAQIPAMPPAAAVQPRSDAFRRARIAAPEPALAGGRPFTEGRFRLVWPYLEIGRDGELRFTPEGELVGLLVVLGPHSGYIEVSAAGEAVDYLLWDDECSYERLGSVVLERFVPAGTEVTIRVIDRLVDYGSAKRPVDWGEAARPRLKLAGLMVRS